jgi:hypothetical protein
VTIVFRKKLFRSVFGCISIQVTQTPFEEQKEQHHLEHNVGWHFQKMKRCFRPLVQGSTKIPALPSELTEIGGNGRLYDLARSTVRTDHPFDSR